MIYTTAAIANRMFLLTDIVFLHFQTETIIQGYRRRHEAISVNQIKNATRKICSSLIILVIERPVYKCNSDQKDSEYIKKTEKAHK